MERVRYAHEVYGIPYSEMLCLTFTNRAARSMIERIRQHIPAHAIEEMYVGNVHRYCMRFLFNNALIPAESSIIDDDDIISIMASYLNIDEETMATMSSLRRQCFDAVHLAAMMFQIENSEPRELRLHPECLTKEDIRALRRICFVEHHELTPATMAAIYHNAADYESMVKGSAYPTVEQPALAALLRKMRAAHYYDTYKRENHLIDFEDLLLLTYEALIHEDTLTADGQQPPFKHYTWCEVDEVQDLNPLQLKIIDLLMAPATDKAPHTMLFLGDEQQAIFSFMGARTSSIEELRQRCKGHIFHLGHNYRAPQYLLNIYNTYAREVLHVSPDLLPQATIEREEHDGDLGILYSATLEEAYSDVALQAKRFVEQHPDESTAILVLTNREADAISEHLDEIGVQHFKVSGTDIFACEEVRTLLATLSVAVNEHNFLAWARILKGYHIFESSTAARSFVRQLADHAMLPSDLYLYPQGSYVKAFAEAYDNEELVVLDTEATGKDAYNDDIVQIAAVKMRGGEVVEGSEFNIFLATRRALPETLGTTANPLLSRYAEAEQFSPAVALSLFLEYVGSATIVGHNIDYDVVLLRENVRRYLPIYPQEFAPTTYDTLRLCRRLFPTLHKYTLAALIATLRLTGQNTHLADDDVSATVALVQRCRRRAAAVLVAQQGFLASRTVEQTARSLSSTFSPVGAALRRRLARRCSPLPLASISPSSKFPASNILSSATASSAAAYEDVGGSPAAGSAPSPFAQSVLAQEIEALHRTLIAVGTLAPSAAVALLCRYVALHTHASAKARPTDRQGRGDPYAVGYAAPSSPPSAALTALAATAAPSGSVLDLLRDALPTLYTLRSSDLLATAATSSATAISSEDVPAGAALVVIGCPLVVATVHKAKGTEFDNVVLFDVAAEGYGARRPSESVAAHRQGRGDSTSASADRQGRGDAVDYVADAEVRRRLYVALTRARRRLLLTVATSRRKDRWHTHAPAQIDKVAAATQSSPLRCPSPLLDAVLPFFPLSHS